MLIREYALTPHIFDVDDEHNRDRTEEWFTRLWDFITKLFWYDSERKIPGIVITNYTDLSFENELGYICNEATREGRSFLRKLRECQKLLKQRYVYRHSDGTHLSSENDWIAQARKTSKIIPIDRIVSTKSLSELSEGQEVFGLYDLHLQESFRIIPKEQISLNPVINEQIDALERLLCFSDVIRLVIPYFCSSLVLRKGACTPHPEADFPVSLLKKKVESCSQFASLKHLDILTNSPDNYDNEKPLIAERIAEFIINEVTGAAFDINVYITDSKINQRRIIFSKERHGDFVTLWCVGMDHYARKGSPGLEKHRFGLLSEEEIIEARNTYFPSARKPLCEIRRRG